MESQPILRTQEPSGRALTERLIHHYHRCALKGTTILDIIVAKLAEMQISETDAERISKLHAALMLVANQTSGQNHLSALAIVASCTSAILQHGILTGDDKDRAIEMGIKASAAAGLPEMSFMFEAIRAGTIDPKTLPKP